MSDRIDPTQTLLVSLSFGLPRQSRQLKREAKEIEENAHAQEGVTKASVLYFVQKQGKETIDALSGLKSYFGLWKKDHERLARIPWAGTIRLLPAALAPAYFEMRAEFERGAPAKLAEFIEVFPDWLATGPHRMGALFDATDFPTETECRERIRWETTLMPLPDSQGWERMALINPDHVAQESSRMNEALGRAREEGRRETWGEIVRHLNHIVDTLSKDRPRIFESLLGNLNSVLALVPAYNSLFNDSEMVRCAEAARSTLGGITAEDLRQDPDVRARTVTAARDLLSQFGEMGNRRLL